MVTVRGSSRQNVGQQVGCVEAAERVERGMDYAGQSGKVGRGVDGVEPIHGL